MNEVIARCAGSPGDLSVPIGVRLSKRRNYILRTKVVCGREDPKSKYGSSCAEDTAISQPFGWDKHPIAVAMLHQHIPINISMNAPVGKYISVSGGEVARAAELLNYQNGSLVTREIVKRTSGGVTIFAFEEGQGLSEHAVPFDALVHVIEGETETSFSGEPHRLQGGELILLPANQRTPSRR